jgi:branched-chain amino acid transport system substrate-binding protein
MNKFTLSVVASAAVLLAACGKKEEAPKATAAAPAASAAPAAAPPPSELVIKIGHVGPTSGAIAHLGKDNEMGARMAIDDLNAKGVMIGGQKAKFELLAEDDAADPKQGTAVAQKLVDAKVQGVIGHLNSGTTIPASQVYNTAGIPQISPSATNPKYTRQGFNTTFRVVADDVQLGSTLGKYAVNELKGKSIAVIDDRTAYGQGVADEFEKAVKAAGGTTLDRQFTTDKATDFTAILTQIKSKKPDVVFFGGMDAVAGPMMRQMKQLGIKAKFVGGDGICSGELPKLAAGAMADGQVVCAEAGGVEGEQKAGMEEFRNKFKAKFNTDVQVYAPYVYDALNVMVAAMEKAGSADPAKYLPELAKTDGYKGVTGTIAFDEKGDIKNGALTLYTYKDGKRDQIAVVR